MVPMSMILFLAKFWEEDKLGLAGKALLLA